MRRPTYVSQSELIGLCVFVLPLLAQAQESAAPGESPTGARQNTPALEQQLEEIMVTAQRRRESLQDVPISVSAFSGEQLERTNIRGAVDYLALTPNVSFTEDAQSGSRGLGIAIRGINNLISGENAFVNSIGIYLDEFSIASVPNGVANPALPDMERVEVLRGPQGTYFGRNSVGGALNLTTRLPTPEFEQHWTIGAESYEGAGEMYDVAGVLNVPVSSTFGVRAVASYENSSGLVENINPLGRSDSGHEWVNLRLRAAWQPREGSDVRVTLIYSDEKQGMDETVPSGVLDLDTVDTFGLQPGMAFDPGTGFWPQNQNRASRDLREFNDLQTKIGIVNFAQRLSDQLVLKTVAGIIEARQGRLFDQDQFGNLDLVSRKNRYDGTSWSAEVRLESTGTAVDWVLGALYANDQQKQENNVAISSDPTATFEAVGFFPPFPAGLGLLLNTKNFEVESTAVFADATWHVTDRLDLLGGARYTRDDVLNERQAFGIAPTLPPGPGFFQSFINVPRPASNFSNSFDDVSPRLGIHYKWTDAVNVYGTFSKGYKAGGASTGNNTNQPGSPSFVVPFEKETAWNYELGVKTELADRRVRLNGAVFFLHWRDLQLEAFRLLTPGDLSSNFEQTINVARAEARGMEVELTALATDRLTLGGSLGYLDTEIKNSTVAEITGGFQVNLQGLELPKAPELTANLFGEYRWPVGANWGWLRGEYVHRAGQYSDVEALTNLQTRGPSPNQDLTRFVPADEFPYLVSSFDVVNVRFGFEWSQAALTLYLQNAFDENYYTGTQENFGLSGIRLRPHPRTYGASLTVRF